MSRCKLIIFEQLEWYHRCLLFWYRLKGVEVGYFRISPSLEKQDWIKRKIEQKQIQKIPFNPILDFFDGFSYTDSFKNLDKVFPLYSARNRFFENLSRLYRTSDIALTLKQLLHHKLARFYYLNKNMNRLSEAYSKKFADMGQISFVPAENISISFGYRGGLLDYLAMDAIVCRSGASRSSSEGIRCPKWALVLSAVLFVFQLIEFCSESLALPVILWFGVIFKKREREDKKRYQIGFMVLSSRPFENDVKSVDFLIDGSLIRKEDVLFLSYNPLTASQVNYLKSKNLNYHSSVNSYDLKFVLEVLPLLLSLLKNLFSMDVRALQISLRLLLYYVRWQSFLERVQLDNLVTQDTDVICHAVARDILLRQKGVVTWKYSDSCSIYNYYVPVEEFLVAKEHIFMFMYCDHLVSWTESNIEVLKTYRPSVFNFHVVGCLWSEQTRLIQEGKILSSLSSELKELKFKKEMRVVTVFDSTYHDNSQSPYSHGFKFLSDIVKLLDDFPDICVLFKEKRPKSYVIERNADIIRFYDSFTKNNRVIFVGNQRAPSELIALSDLVVCYPFTSPGLEALSSRVRTLWHDPEGSFRNTYYDQIPGLVTHNFEDLRRRVKELLFESTGDDYDAYLKRYVSGRLIQYFDGMGITRFRSLLKKSTFSNSESDVRLIGA